MGSEIVGLGLVGLGLVIFVAMAAVCLFSDVVFDNPYTLDEIRQTDETVN